MIDHSCTLHGARPWRGGGSGLAQGRRCRRGSGSDLALRVQPRLQRGERLDPGRAWPDLASPPSMGLGGFVPTASEGWIPGRRPRTAEDVSAAVDSRRAMRRLQGWTICAQDG